MFHKFILRYQSPTALVLTVRIDRIITINYQALFRHNRDYGESKVMVRYMHNLYSCHCPRSSTSGAALSAVSQLRLLSIAYKKAPKKS